MEDHKKIISILKETALPVCVFAAGICAGRSGFTLPQDASGLILIALIVLTGLSLGSNPSAGRLFKLATPRMLSIPLSVMAGTAAGNAILSLLPVGLTLRESVLIGAGYGYYSLSSVLISGHGLKELGAAALFANIMREVITLALAGYMVRFFGKAAPILSGGATSMDVTLPAVISKSGEEYAVVSVFSGVLLTLAVPVVITAILNL